VADDGGFWGVCECFLSTLLEKDKQKCSQRVLGLVAYEIYMFLILKPSKQ
jgi:hypothetical protein